MILYKTLETDIIPVGDRVLVSDMNFGEVQTKGGILLLDDNMQNHGIKPRWAKVYAKGPRNKEDYQVGDWIYIEHARWTRAVNIKKGDQILAIRMVDPEFILMMGKEKPKDWYYNKLAMVNKS